MNETELARLLSIFSPMTEYETRDFIYLKRRSVRRFSYEFAAGLGIDVDGQYESTLINKIQSRLAEIRLGIVPDVPPVGECMGCGEAAEATGLRWKKLNDGGTLTISVDHSAKPQSLRWLTNDVILEEWAQPWSADNNNIKFQMMTRTRGDVHIKFEPIDGPGNTLAYVWQPAGNAEFMSSAGDLSGDMVIDNSEVEWPRLLVHEVGKHEFGHALGLGHGNAAKDVMYPTAKGEFKALSTNDIKQRNERYPT